MMFPNGECGQIVPPNAIMDLGLGPGDISIQVQAWIVLRNWMNSNLVEEMMQIVPLLEVKKERRNYVLKISHTFDPLQLITKVVVIFYLKFRP